MDRMRREHPLDLSARIIDSGICDVPVKRITQKLSQLTDEIALVESFAHSCAVRTSAGLVVADTSGVRTGGAVVDALRGWCADPVATIIYTHGHLDHVGGSGAFAADAAAHHYPPPQVVAHRAVPDRLARYRRTEGWNLAINARQFGSLAGSNADLSIGGDGTAAQPSFVPADILEPDVTYDRTYRLQVGGTILDLHHERGETDDQTWVWLPKQRTVLAGDFLIWDFPSAGNPQKVQRYPDRWAIALRNIIAAKPELLVPAHGLPIAGNDRITLVLDEVASVLERLVADVIAAMNAGATLDEVVQSVRVDPDTLGRPWLRPFYDEPEFVVRNVWRLYGGWWDADLARLKPPCRDSLAAEVAALVGGAPTLAARAATLADGGDLRLACQLIEWAHAAAPNNAGIADRRRALYRLRSDQETSLMAKGIFRSA